MWGVAGVRVELEDPGQSGLNKEQFFSFSIKTSNIFANSQNICHKTGIKILGNPRAACKSDTTETTEKESPAELPVPGTLWLRVTMALRAFEAKNMSGGVVRGTWVKLCLVCFPGGYSL